MAETTTSTTSEPGSENGTTAQTAVVIEEFEKNLGDAGKKALDEERAARKEAEKAAKALQTELDKIKTANMSEQEKAVAAARAEGREAALAEANDRLLRSEIRAAAGGKMADPSDAPALLGDLAVFLDRDGEPDQKAIVSAIDALVKAKPYLAIAGLKPGPLSGGGAKPSSGLSLNDEIRRAAGH